MKPGNIAVVTGASAGIGRELVVQLVRDRGMTVLATARRIDRLQSLAAELPGGKVHTLAGDLADPEFRSQLWTHAESLFPQGIDVLVNNAGLGNYSEFADQDQHAWRAMIEVNIVALMDLTQKAIVHMKARKSGQIVEVASVLGFVAIPYSAVYVATKHAVIGLVKALRCELDGTGVKVWAACPGRTESEFSSVAAGGPIATDRGPKAEPTDRIVRSLVRGLDRNKMIVMTSPTAWWAVWFAHWFSGPFHWVMERYSRGIFRKELEMTGAKRS